MGKRFPNWYIFSVPMSDSRRIIASELPCNSFSILSFSFMLFLLPYFLQNSFTHLRLVVIMFLCILLLIVVRIFFCCFGHPVLVVLLDPVSYMYPLFRQSLLIYLFEYLLFWSFHPNLFSRYFAPFLSTFARCCNFFNWPFDKNFLGRFCISVCLL